MQPQALLDAKTIEPGEAYVVQNAVLAALPPESFRLVRPHLRHVSLRRRVTLEGAHAAASVQFIESGLVSRVIYSRRDGQAEIALVGRSGLIGEGAILGVSSSNQREIVHVSGRALQLPAVELARIMHEAPAVRDHLLRYVQVLLMLRAQLTFCNAKHETELRVARWLSSAMDAVDKPSLPVTHETLATMLGVRRPGVSRTLERMERENILHCGRGAIQIVDGEKLQRMSCECHRIMRRELGTLREAGSFEHLLG
jgi:CRP-like cAMP-binding protein